MTTNFVSPGPEATLMKDRATTRRKFLQSTLAGATALGAEEAALAKGPDRPPALKISAVQTYYLEYQLPKAIGPSTAMYRTRDALLVKVTTDAGVVGWGETASLGGVRATIDELGKTLVGRNPLEHRKLWRELWGPNFGNGLAVGGLDMALQDIRGKALNLSVAELYGGRLRDRVPAYAAAMNYTEGEDPTKQYPEEAKGLVKSSFGAMKMRLGGLP